MNTDEINISKPYKSPPINKLKLKQTFVNKLEQIIQPKIFNKPTISNKSLFKSTSTFPRSNYMDKQNPTPPPPPIIHKQLDIENNQTYNPQNNYQSNISYIDHNLMNTLLNITIKKHIIDVQSNIISFQQLYRNSISYQQHIDDSSFKYYDIIKHLSIGLGIGIGFGIIKILKK